MDRSAGRAIAQAYGHAILPLCNEHDVRTHVRWGILDFAHRFGRQPAGMWLPETAVDVPTLEVLARHGIRFTILSPYQAKRVRRLPATTKDADDEDAGGWKDVAGGIVDPSRPYLQRLPSGRSITVFFYDRQVSQVLSFAEQSLRDQRLGSALWFGGWMAFNLTNQIELSVVPNARGHVLLVARYDNLGKGACGAAVQNLNLMLGFSETLGSGA